MDETGALEQQLGQVVTNSEVTTVADVLHAHSVDGILPRIIITPTTKEEAAKTVALASEYKATLTAYGNGTQSNLGGIPEHIDVLLKTTKLCRLLEHEAADLTCQTEVGITLAELQSQLASKGQRLSLDPPNAEQTTIGGLLATNASGPKRLRYGTARDLVIGLKVIQANGEITRSGGNVVKNVAGYDLNKLYIGSLGTLGIIVEANFKLHPIPSTERTILLSYTKVEDAMDTVVAIAGSLLTPSAIELIDANAAIDMADFFGLHLPANGYTLAVNFEGSANAVNRQIDETRLIARKRHALLGEDLEGKDQEHFWNAIREHTQGTLTCKAAILVSQIATYLKHVERVCQRHELEAAVVAHAGNGVLYIELRPGDALPRVIEAIAELRQFAREARGSLVVERCPVDTKRQLEVWGEPGTDFRMMQRLKQQFDPTGTFVKGRFLGGL